MFTVVIAESECLETIHKHQLFFEPFLDNKNIAFCQWNPDAETVADAVPDLVRTVGRNKEWRAVIIGEGKYSEQENPFDTVNHSEQEALIKPPYEISADAEKQSEEKPQKLLLQTWQQYGTDMNEAMKTVYRRAMSQPLTKLLTRLCFVPNTVKLGVIGQDKDVFSWAVSHTDSDIKDEKIGEGIGLIENDLARNKSEEKENLRLAFVDGKAFEVVLPNEVLCVAERTTENGYYNPALSWKDHSSLVYSEFCDRNMYFDKSKFLVFDALPKNNRNYGPDKIKFLYSVLVLATNPIPSDILKCRCLHRIDSSSDETVLTNLISTYAKKLDNTEALLQVQIHEIRDSIPPIMTDDDMTDFFSENIVIPAKLGKDFDREEMTADEKEYGFASNCPRPESMVWYDSYKTADHAVDKLVKKPRRILQRAVEETRQKSVVADEELCRMDELQIQDVKDHLESTEEKMLKENVNDIYDVERYHSMLEQESNKVRKVIERRMSRKATIIFGVACLVLFLLCFLPTIVKNNGSLGVMTTSVMLTIVSVALLGGVLLVSLWFLRKPLIDAVRHFNDVSQEIIGEVEASLSHFARYLSCVCRIRRGYQMIDSATNALDKYTLMINLRKKYIQDVKKQHAVLEEDYAEYITDDADCDEELAKPYPYNFAQRKEFVYPAPYIKNQGYRVPFVDSFNTVLVPNRFITGMTIKTEELYDD